MGGAGGRGSRGFLGQTGDREHEEEAGALLEAGERVAAGVRRGQMSRRGWPGRPLGRVQAQAVVPARE